MSKLIVEICKVERIEAHPNADRLDLIFIKGWQCIVSKGQYNAGDLVIFCPIDSIIPQNLVEKYKLEFLKKDGRVKTIKLRKTLSQGLVLDLSCLPAPQSNFIQYSLGLNVAEILGIAKYEEIEPEHLKVGIASKNKRNPYFDKYTDIENINNFNEELREGEHVIISEKLHGTSARYGNLKRPYNNILDWFKNKLFGEYEFVYGSRNVQKKWLKLNNGYYKEDVYGQIAKKYNIAAWLPKDYILYGEIIGKGIQDLEYGMKDIDLYIYDVKYKGKYLDMTAYLDFCHKYFIASSIQTVPYLYHGTYIKDLEIQYREGKSLIAPNQIREGCVIRLQHERESHMGRVILKSINPEYLTRKNGTEYK